MSSVKPTKEIFERNWFILYEWRKTAVILTCFSYTIFWDRTVRSQIAVLDLFSLWHSYLYRVRLLIQISKRKVDQIRCICTDGRFAGDPLAVVIANKYTNTANKNLIIISDKNNIFKKPWYRANKNVWFLTGCYWISLWITYQDILCKRNSPFVLVFEGRDYSLLLTH